MSYQNENAHILNKDTGEIMDVVIHKEVSSQNFEKIFLTDLLLSLQLLNVKALDVLLYIIKNRNYSNNTLIATQQEIAKGSKVSLRTVSNIMKALQKGNFLVKKSSGVYIINPQIIIKGNENKKRMVVEYYRDVQNKNDKNTD